MHLVYVVAAFMWMLLCFVGGMPQVLLVASGAFAGFCVSALTAWVQENFILIRLETSDDEDDDDAK